MRFVQYKVLSFITTEIGVQKICAPLRDPLRPLR
jgi:hypothetical protein